MSFRLPASYVSKAHTIFASVAFLSSLVIGVRLHYHKIVKNEVAGYPDEWFPSVSATIGDWYPERSIFQILIALTAGPRFGLVFCWWLLTRSATSMLPTFVAFSGVARTFACGGWVYITSTDDHDAHDILMISYMVLNLPWMIGCIVCTPHANTTTKKRRKLVATLFFLAIIPMVYLFIQHKVYKIPGAYTKYSFFEWFLIFSDIWFDSITASDLSTLEITVARSLPETTHSKKSLAVKDHLLSPSDPSSPNILQAMPNPVLSVKRTTSEILFKKGPSARLNVSTFWQHGGSFLADVYLAYMWWTIFTSLPPSLFYFSVWQLSISGQEISLIATLSPVLLGIPSIRTILSTRRGRVWLQILSVTGLVAYKIEGPLSRLLAVSFANVVGSILRAIEWSDRWETEKHGIILSLGLVVASLTKLVNHSVNPLWPFVNAQSGGWNKMGILLATLSILDYAARGSFDMITRNRNIDDMSHKKFDDVSSAAKTIHTITPSNLVADAKGGIFEHWSFFSIGLGGLIFSLHRFLADSGTLIAQSWTGYPVTGPVPGFHGYLTLMAVGLGIIISSSGPKQMIRHPVWMAFGALMTCLMYQLRDWPGYIGGLGLSTFLSSITPEIIGLAAVHGRRTPGRVYFTAWLTVCILDLADVWTVAYAFVPAGWLLRERTDIVLVMQLTAIGLALILGRRISKRSPFPSFMVSSFRQKTGYLSVSLIITSLLATTARFPGKTPVPHHAAQRLITAGIWTVHFGIDDAGRESQYRMRDLIRDLELDVVGLLETDLHRIVFGNRDLTRVISEDLGYFVDIGPGPTSHTWGAVLLSKFPILSSTHHLLPSPHGELAPAISAILDVWGQNITVIVSHNGQEEDALDRELQSTELARIMAATYPDPVIFLGYVVTTPHAARPHPYEILVTDGGMHDIDDEDWDRWCEYILYRGLYRVAYARVSRSTITDTELQAGKFVVPKLGHPIVNASREERYLRSYREILPSEMWFPDEYLDQLHPGGKNGHYYHVHPWPLYYGLPDNATV